MRGRHRNTLQAIFADPVQANVLWADVEALFVAAGASISQGRGSRVRVSLNGVDAVFHRPHPAKETERGALRSVRRFLREAGVMQ
jgi:HicA-like toxin of HicAB toxin-antitoxin system